MIVPYYPKIDVIKNETCFGVQELTPSDLYDRPLYERIIYKFDLLEALRDLLGDTACLYRNFLYTLVAGKVDETYSDTALQIGYRIFSTVRQHVNYLSIYGDNFVPLNKQFHNSCLKLVDIYRNQLKDKYCVTGVKLLPETHLYFYITTTFELTITERGVTKIC